LLLAGGAAAHPSRGIVATTDGRIYFSDLERLWMIGRDGRLRKVRETRDRHTHELFLDHSGNVIGEDSQHADGTYRESIWQLAPSGRFRTLYGPTQRVARGMGIVRDARGCTYHSDRVMPARRPIVHRRCPGRPAERLLGNATDDAAFRQDLISNVAGATIDRGGGFLFRQGTNIRRIARDGSVRTIAREIADENFGIAVAGNAVLVAEARARRVVRIEADGRRSLAATSARPWFPTGVAAARGSLYLLEATDYRRGEATRMRVRWVDRDNRTRVLATVAIPL
jgi:hypothetical protein